MRIGTKKIVIALFCTLFLGTDLFAAHSTNFGLVFESETKIENLKTDQEIVDYKQINAYFNKIDNKLSNGIRFGVDKLVNLKFKSEKSLLLDPACENFQAEDYIEIQDEETFLINGSIKDMILDHSIRKKMGTCSHQDLLVKAMEQQLLSLPGAHDLKRKFTRDEKKLINTCHEFRRRREVRRLRFNPTLSEKCKATDQLLRKRVALKRYENDVRSLLYNAKVEFDATSFSDTKLQRYQICKTDYKPTKVLKNGKRIKMLGMAIVYMAPGYTTSVAGHVAERYVYCLDNELKDLMFEYTQMTEEETNDVRYVYDEQSEGVSQDYIKSLVGSIYIKVKHDVANNELNGYGFVQFHTNRDVIEVWPKYSQDEMFDGLQTSLKEFKKQKQRYIDREAFPAYSVLNNNCTHPIRERLRKYAGGELEIDNLRGMVPIWIFGFLKNQNVDKLVLYPSQRLLRKYKMMEKGKSLFWENTTFWSRASKGAENHSTLILYPDHHGFLKRLILNPVYGVFNLTASILQSTLGVLKMPLKWLSKLPGFKWMEPKKDPKTDIALGFQGVQLSFSEMFGVRLRYPSATEWSEEEKTYIFTELPHQEPAIVDYLYEKVQQ